MSTKCVIMICYSDSSSHALGSAGRCPWVSQIHGRSNAQVLC